MIALFNNMLVLLNITRAELEVFIVETWLLIESPFLIEWIEFDRILLFEAAPQLSSFVFTAELEVTMGTCDRFDEGLERSLAAAPSCLDLFLEQPDGLSFDLLCDTAMGNGGGFSSGDGVSFFLEYFTFGQLLLGVDFVKFSLHFEDPDEGDPCRFSVLE